MATLSTCCCSVAKSCQSLCNPVECTMPSSSNYFPGFARIAVHWVDDAIYQLIVFQPLLLQPFQASGSFPMNQLFPSSGQCIGALASPSLLPMNFQDWFPLGLTGLISLQSKRLPSLLQHDSPKASVLQCSFLFEVPSRICLQCRRPRFDSWVRKSHGEGNGNPLQCSCLENSMDRGAWQATVHGVTKIGHTLATKLSFFMVRLLYSCISSGKTIALCIRTFVSKVMSLVFNTLSRFIIVFLPVSTQLLMSWMQSTSSVIFGAQENKVCHCFYFSPLFICHKVLGLDAMILIVWMLSFKLPFLLYLVTLIKRLFSSFSLSSIRVAAIVVQSLSHVWFFATP